ncbi:MAG TPA: amidohydrolase family protein [Candidatus Tumulicola sp.]
MNGRQSLTIFENVRIFTGGDELSAPTNVSVAGNRIDRIGQNLVSDSYDDADVIEGGRRTLLPGLIDAHWHTMWATVPMQVLMTSDTGYINLLAARSAEQTLMRGFTTVRDAGGPVFGLKRAIDSGLVPGPRIYPSGALISQTSGHGDFRMPWDVPRAAGAPLTHMEREGHIAIADSPDEVRLRTREQLRLGATQIKLMAGGGVSSPHDPLDSTQFTSEEMRAAVDAADNWNTYVMVHAYTPRAIRQAVDAGVRCIEHGQLVDEPTAELLARREIWLSLQPFLPDGDAAPTLGAHERIKHDEMTQGTSTAYELAKRYGIRTAFGTDTLFEAKLAERQGAQLTKLLRWYTPAQVLAMATRDNAELLAMCGPRNPYPGALGVVEEGALADLLLVDGDPIDDLRLLEDYARNIVVIMKDGIVYKDATVPDAAL